VSSFVIWKFNFVRRKQPDGQSELVSLEGLGVSMETTNRRMSNDMSWPLCGMPNDTILNAQVANACLPAGERPNKAPIFNLDVSDSRSFLAWLRASCPDGMMSQLKVRS